MRHGKLQRFGGQNVYEICGGGKRFNPIGSEHTPLEQQRANDIINGTNNALSFTVLGGSGGTRHTKMNSMSKEECAGTRVVELVAVVALNCLNGGAVLGGHMSKEISKS